MYFFRLTRSFFACFVGLSFSGACELQNRSGVLGHTLHVYLCVYIYKCIILNHVPAYINVLLQRVPALSCFVGLAIPGARQLPNRSGVVVARTQLYPARGQGTFNEYLDAYIQITRFMYVYTRI